MINCTTRLASEETTKDIIQVTIMPNPTNGDLRVEVKLSEPSAVEFSLLDLNCNPKLLGNSVENTDRHQWQADLTQWVDGLYLLRTQTSTSQKITKIWKLSK